MPLLIKQLNKRRQVSSLSNSSRSSSISKAGKNLTQVLDPEELSDRLLKLSSALFQKGVIKDYQLVKVIEKNAKSPFKNQSPNESFGYNDDLSKNQIVSKEGESRTGAHLKQEKLDTYGALDLSEQGDAVNNISEGTSNNGTSQNNLDNKDQQSTLDEKINNNFRTFSNEYAMENSEVAVLQTIQDQEITMFGSTFGTDTYNCVNGSVKTLGSEVIFY